MATYFIDLDGCIAVHGSNNLLPGAQELLDKIISSGGKIIFTTRRGDKEFKNHKIYCAESARQLVRSLKVPYEALILDVDSPRIVINDSGAIAINHLKNKEWSKLEIENALKLK